MANATKAYNSDQLQLVIGAFAFNTGRAADEFVSVSYNSDFHTIQVGSDGEVTRSRVNDRSATITITLTQSSDGNDVLTGIWATDLNTPGGTPVPFLLRDSLGRTLLTAEQCWLKTAPSASYGSEAGTREWVFETGNLIAFYGGNT